MTLSYNMFVQVSASVPESSIMAYNQQMVIETFNI